jgi:EmrB/QacA subfamily drug resistance transporter
MSFKSQSNPWWVLSGLMLLLLLINVDFSAVNLALVTISMQMNEELDVLQWLLSGYVLAWGAVVILAGKLADIYGKRRMILIGISVFMLSSLAIGFGTEAWMLIVGRLVQGIGGALLLPPIYTLTFSVLPPEKSGFGIGLLGVSCGLGLAIGPSFGGMLIDTLGWEWIFFVNIPFCLVVMAIIMKSVKKEPKRLLDESIDKLGALLIAAVLSSFVYALNQSTEWGFTSTKFLGLIGISIALLSMFIMWQKKCTYPLVKFSLFKNRIFLGATITFTLLAYIFSTSLLTIGLYLQNVLNYDAYDAGLIFLAMTLCIGTLSPYGGRMVDTMDPRIPMIAGFVFTGVGVGLISLFFTQTASLWIIIPTLCVLGVGIGIGFPSTNTIMMKSTEPSDLNTASALFGMFATLGNSLGVVVSSELLTLFTQKNVFASLADNNIDLNPEEVTSLSAFLSQTNLDQNTLKELSTAISSDLPGSVAAGFTSAFHTSTWVAVVFAVICLITSAVMIKPFKETNNV